MNTSRARQPERWTPPRFAPGFTIAELIVAIGVTIILIIGISRIFATSKKTIGLGQATSELGQYGRTLERLMRADFSALTRKGFLVIRGERLGPDAVSSGPNGNYRSSIYLNADEAEAQIDLGTRRLDQIVFFATGDYTTYEYRDGVSNQIARNDTSAVSRIWYGHGLRDPDFYDPGTFGEIKGGPGVNNYKARFAEYAPTSQDTVNRYAQDWILARQPALLLPRSSVGAEFQLSFAPSYIEYYNESPNDPYWPDEFFNTPPDDFDSPLRRLSAGYVDLIDMDLVSVEKTVTEYGHWMYDTDNSRSGEIGDWTDPFGNLYGGSWRDYLVNRALQGSPNDPIAWSWVQGQVLRMMFATGRLRVESAAPSTERLDQMMTHATLIPGCSDFQVAWSTGETVYPSGDIVWYGLDNPANPDPALHPNQALDQIVAPTDRRTYQLGEYTYNRMLTSGPLMEDAREDLYYAIFGYFVPKVQSNPTLPDDRSETWPWPKMIRIRATLHDQTGRMPGGRRFEFVFNLPEPLPG